MKKILILIVTFISMSTYAQNRYSNYSTSSYEPEVQNQDYYKAMAEQKIESIKNQMYYYDDLTKEALKSNSDIQFKTDIYEVVRYLNILKQTNSMSFSKVDSYLRLINKKYNKAVRKYNKRLKKE